MSTEYRLWIVFEGALDDDEVFQDEDERDKQAAAVKIELERDHAGKDWQIMTANVTKGCSVGEWAGEEAHIYAQGNEDALLFRDQ